ncbi:NAD-dependent epimerase/dehydratase family protein [Hoeflea sp.]|uniref:NAD-dependent epimerase/dehydratase family protein n=1 Tax=Hoeflea sp. TaxID=1940281 RepID=UPI003B013557
MESVLLTGATGLVGGSVLRALIAARDVHGITSLGRRPSGLADAKLREVQIDDFADVAALSEHLRDIETIFHCLATYSNTASREDYETVTLTWLDALLQAASETAPQATFCLFSAAGARPDGGGLSFALRTKGAAENLLFEAALPRKFAFRPGYIAPSRPREKPKISDAIATPIFRLIPAIGVTSDELADAMLNVARNEQRSQAVFENSELRQLSKPSTQGTSGAGFG